MPCAVWGCPAGFRNRSVVVYCRTMIEEFVASMAAKVGISEEQANQVIEFLKENADKLPELLGSDALSGLKDKLPGGIGDLLG